MTYAYGHNWIVQVDDNTYRVVSAPVYVNDRPMPALTEQTLALVLRAEMREKAR